MSKQIIHVLIGLFLFILFAFLLPITPEEPAIRKTLAIAVLMAYWWITEAIPIAATSLLPVILFPLLGVMNGKDISATYFNHLIFLFIGGFIMAIAMEKWNLHKRIALTILIYVGTSPARILFGFMAATFFLSMWMSNTATAMLMISIGLSIIIKLNEELGAKKTGKFPIAMLLGIAYASSIGGIATLVGTPPNLSFARISSIIFPKMPEITFADWMIFALPVSFLVLIIAYLVLYFLFRPKENWNELSRNTFLEEKRNLGKISFEERTVFILLITMAVLWIFRANIDIGRYNVPGWSQHFPLPDYINDGTVAIFVSLLLFIIPSKSKDKKPLINWDNMDKIPWHIVLLFGGGFALATGFVESGLSVWLGEQLQFLEGTPLFLLILGIVLFMTFLTELTSNTATTEMILPILAGLAVAIKVNPLLLMLPATFAASLAFMLPVATPPNAIVFSSGHLRIKDMALTGLILNLITAFITTLGVYYWGTYVFDINPAIFPEWAM